MIRYKIISNLLLLLLSHFSRFGNLRFQLFNFRLSDVEFQTLVYKFIINLFVLLLQLLVYQFLGFVSADDALTNDVYLFLHSQSNIVNHFLKFCFGFFWLFVNHIAHRILYLELLEIYVVIFVLDKFVLVNVRKFGNLFDFFLLHFVHLLDQFHLS